MSAVRQDIAEILEQALLEHPDAKVDVEVTEVLHVTTRLHCKPEHEDELRNAIYEQELLVMERLPQTRFEFRVTKKV